MLPGARPGHPEAQNAPEPAREAQNGVDSRSRFCKLQKSWSKVRFRSETKPPLGSRRDDREGDVLLLDSKTKLPLRKPNSYPYSYPLDPKTKFLSLRIRIWWLIRRRKALDFLNPVRTNLWTQMVIVC